MLAERVIQSIHQDHPHAHIWMKPSLKNKLDFAGDRVGGHRDLPGLPLVLTFVDYKKSFDSVEANAILSALVDEGVDASFLSNLRFADDIVLFLSSTNEAEAMLNELSKAGKKIGLRINREKTQFMKNAYCEDGGLQL
ncbi:hypothetical protein RB195_013615 [Necator americanus]|uniref:Reverse transcriptase domain-containing protein n=1 Tax=Necator americanus TaxID=51031 RepID=A0ABR1DWJ5_NECAM